MEGLNPLGVLVRPQLSPLELSLSALSNRKSSTAFRKRPMTVQVVRLPTGSVFF